MLGLMYIFALSFSIDHEVFSDINYVRGGHAIRTFEWCLL